MSGNETSLRLKTLWPIIFVGGGLISAAFIVDWIGVSEPGDFGFGQFLLLSAGLLVLALGLLGRKIATVYRVTAILLLNTILMLVFLELAAALALRVVDLFPTVPDIRKESSYYDSQDWAADYWREFAVSESNQYLPWVIWRRRPFNGKTINIDQEGLRATPGAVCDQGSYKVFAFGGSTLWGTGSPDWETIPAYLQRGLEVQHDGPVCVVNFGEAAYVSTQGVIALLGQLQVGNSPDMVLFYDGFNDVVPAWRSGVGGAHHNLPDIAARFKGGNQRHPLMLWVQRFSLYKLFERTVPDGLIPAPEPVTYLDLGLDAETTADSVAQVYLGNYEIVDALAQKYGFEYYFFWQPAMLASNKPLTPEEQLIETEEDEPSKSGIFKATYRRIEQAAARYENLYYIADAFDNEEAMIWIDGVHVTPVGNQLIAREMLGAIKENLLQASKDR